MATKSQRLLGQDISMGKGYGKESYLPKGKVNFTRWGAGLFDLKGWVAWILTVFWKHLFLLIDLEELSDIYIRRSILQDNNFQNIITHRNTPTCSSSIGSTKLHWTWFRSKWLLIEFNSLEVWKLSFHYVAAALAISFWIKIFSWYKISI